MLLGTSMFHSQLSADCGTGIKISAQWLICLGLAAQESLHAAKINFSYSGPQNSDSKCYPTSATPSTDHWDPGLNSAVRNRVHQVHLASHRPFVALLM